MNLLNGNHFSYFHKRVFLRNSEILKSVRFQNEQIGSMFRDKIMPEVDTEIYSYLGFENKPQNISINSNGPSEPLRLVLSNCTIEFLYTIL